MDEEGLRGSLYPAKILSAITPSGGPARAMVEYETLTDEGGAPLVEPVDLAQLVPVGPTPPPTARWLEGLSPGASLDMLHEGGWWHVHLCSRPSGPRSGAEVRAGKHGQVEVEVVGYHFRRWTECSNLRPRCASRRI